MMDSIRLSICIATLNRAAFIGTTLDSIIAQATNEVEIIVVDGASNDNTEQVVRQRQLQFPRLRYLRLEAKGGVDQDYCKAVELACGDYCWLFSDDDLMKPGALQIVIHAICKNYALIIVNAEGRSHDLSKVIEIKILKKNTDRIYRISEQERFLIEIGPYLSFIGCVVIERKIWNQREKEKYFGTEFIHVGVILQSPLPKDTLVIAEPLIMARYGFDNSTWSSRWFEIWAFKWPNLIWSFQDFSDSAKLQVYAREPWRQLRTLLLFRARGYFSMKEYHDWIESRLDSSWRKLATRLLAKIPGIIANYLAIVYYSTKGPDACHLLFDLRDSRFYYRRRFKQTASSDKRICTNYKIF